MPAFKPAYLMLRRMIACSHAARTAESKGASWRMRCNFRYSHVAAFRTDDLKHIVFMIYDTDTRI